MNSHYAAKLLQDYVNHATVILSDVMGIGGSAAAPKAKLGKGNHFHSRKRLVVFTPERLAQDPSIAVGHEVGHSLHHLVNREIFRVRNNDRFYVETENAVELVANYLAQIFAAYEQALSPNRRMDNLQKVMGDIHRSSGLGQSEEVSFGIDEEKWNALTHDGGYSAAFFLLHRFGGKMAKTLPRLALQDIKELLTRSGYGLPLVMSYDRDESITMYTGDVDANGNPVLETRLLIASPEPIIVRPLPAT